MRILYCNWVPSRDFRTFGGGVSIYQQNLIREFLAHGHEVYYLTSGTAFSALDRHVHIRPVAETIDPRLQEYEIVNSPLLAPSFYAFDALEEYFDEAAVPPVLQRFLAERGPFDVIHFNNIEGMPISCLKLKEALPSVRIVYSLHNYFPFCPQVNLWYRDREMCTDFWGGAKCVTCNVFPISSYHVRLERKLDDFAHRCGVRPDSRLGNRLKRTVQRMLPLVERARAARRRVHDRNGARPEVSGPREAHPLLFVGQDAAGRFRTRRELMVRYINAYVDVVHAVSERTRQIAIRHGVDRDKVVTAYIATRHAEAFDPGRVVRGHDGVLGLGYLGYMRVDKGFYFLLDCLERMPDDLASSLAVTIAAPVYDHGVVERVRASAYRFRELKVYDGYAQDSLPSILKNVHLGVVPVLWEDNLPQVAIEFVCHGVPVLSSDLGGAQEVGADERFVFRAGSTPDFFAKVRAFVEHPSRLADFWQGGVNLRSWSRHYDEMLSLYSASSTATLHDVVATARRTSSVPAEMPRRRGTEDASS